MNLLKNGMRQPVRGVSAIASMMLASFACAATAEPTDSSEDPLKLHLQVMNLSLKNMGTGPRPYTYANNGVIVAGADLDLGRIAGLEGAKLQFDYIFFPWMRGEGVPTQNNWQGAVGSMFGGAPMHNDIDSGYLGMFAYSQTALDGRLDFTIGRTNAKRHFYMVNCDNFVACNDPIVETATGVLPYPYGSWGGYSRYRLDDSRYVHAGVFESNPAHYLKETSGWNWDPGDASGVSVLAGVGSEKTFAQSAYAHHYELNAFFNSSKQVDPLDGSTHQGSSGMLFRFRQTLARDDDAQSGAPEKAWQAFGTWSWSADDVQPFEHYLEAGITRIGPFGRPQDTVNLKASYLRMGDKQARYQEQQRFSATGIDQGTKRGISRLELNTHWQVTRNLAFEPSVQYIFNPDNYFNPQAPVSSNGAVLGVQVIYDLGSAIGL